LHKKNSSHKFKSIFYGRAKVIAIISIVLIISISYGLFFYFQGITESNIKNNLFEQDRDRQIEATRSLSQHIGSDLALVEARLETLSNSIYLQQGDLTSNKTKTLMQTNFLKIDNIVDHLFVVNKNNIITIDMSTKGAKTFAGSNVSQREYVIQAKKTEGPVFSTIFMGLDGNYRIGISYPIINVETGQYMGVVGSVIPTEGFFAHYGNIYDINSRFLVVFDTNGIMLANGASKTLVGKDFFGDYTQKFINYNPRLNNLTRSLLAGNSGYAVYDYRRGERITTQYPILVNGEPIYYVQFVQPTTQIYSKLNDILFSQRIETFSLLAGATVAIVLLIVFLSKWSSLLGREVQRRTRVLELSNEEIRLHLDFVQKEVERFKRETQSK
jgi:hypothetical protein